MQTIPNHCQGFDSNKTANRFIEIYVIEGQSILPYRKPQADRSTNGNMLSINLAIFKYYNSICFLLHFQSGTEAHLTTFNTKMRT
jgi:hypothetical protein